MAKMGRVVVMQLGRIDRKAMLKFLTDSLKQLTREKEAVPAKQFELLATKWKSKNEALLRIVSGKDYLIHLLQHRVNFCIGKGKTLFPKQSLKLFLANHCNLERLDFLKNKL